jgi:hypothetical protein
MKRTSTYQGYCKPCQGFIVVPLTYQDRSSLLYGCTTWGTTKAMIRRAFAWHIKQYHKAPKLRVIKDYIYLNEVKS